MWRVALRIQIAMTAFSVTATRFAIRGQASVSRDHRVPAAMKISVLLMNAATRGWINASVIRDVLKTRPAILIPENAAAAKANPKPKQRPRERGAAILLAEAVGQCVHSAQRKKHVLD